MCRKIIISGASYTFLGIRIWLLKALYYAGIDLLNSVDGVYYCFQKVLPLNESHFRTQENMVTI